MITKTLASFTRRNVEANLIQNSELNGILGEAATLTSYAVRFRYPDAEDAEPTVEESKTAIRIAKAVFKELLALIPTENPMGF